MLKSKIFKLLYMNLLIPGRFYKKSCVEIKQLVRNFLRANFVLALVSVVFLATMIVTKAYSIAIVSAIFLLVTIASHYIGVIGYIKISSNLTIVSLYVAFFLGVKLDQYKSIYELYVYGAFALVLTLVTCLISYSKKQIAAIYLLNLIGILNMWINDIVLGGSILTPLHLQSIVTVIMLITIGTLTAYRVATMQVNLVSDLSKEKNQVDRMLRIAEVYTKKSLVSIITHGGDPTTYSPMGKDIAVQFCDIRDFTTISETMNATDTVRLLNSFFERMNIVIQDGLGEIDKLIGDCIMASFNNCADAVKTSINMALVLQEYNKLRIGYNLNPIHTGTGIGYGNVAVGNIGSSNKMDYTVVGDVVNISSRLESLTKQCGVDMIISEEVYNRIDKSDYMRYLGDVMVKGRVKPVKIYEIFGHEIDSVKEQKVMTKPRFYEALELYENHKYVDAAKIYRELIGSLGPHSYRDGYCLDPLLHYYYKLCSNY